MGNLRNHAERELRAQGYHPGVIEEDPNRSMSRLERSIEPHKWIWENVLELIDVFASQGHSGSSAPYCILLFSILASFKPLGPLYGTPDEWVGVADGLEQNVRCGRVFRENGEAYDVDGKVFRAPNGCTYTSRDSRVPVEFPYTPKTVTIDVPGDEETLP